MMQIWTADQYQLDRLTAAAAPVLGHCYKAGNRHNSFSRSAQRQQIQAM
jgi:hypothetical protein